PGSDMETGLWLGGQLARAGVKPDSPVMLFYGPGDPETCPRLPKATWLLEGVEKGLGFLPPVTGAGLRGDYLCRPRPRDAAPGACGELFALAFSDDVLVESTVIHGCTPITPYHTVTKAVGATVTEIDGVPALAMLNDLLGSALTLREYPFSLLLGVNYGELMGDFTGEDYVTRLCIGVDEEQGGIVMSEPDMREGTRFQLMARPLELTYIKPVIEEAFARLAGREPIFALYIDCIGRCAGYGDLETEDALVMQKALGDKVPFLGIYMGAEIAPVGGRSRPLDWTGVLCLLSKREGGGDGAAAALPPAAQQKKTTGDRCRPQSDEEVRLGSMPGICKRNTAKILKMNAQYLGLQYELEHRRRGFNLLAELTVFLRHGRVGSGRALFHVAQRISAVLGMHKTAALMLGEDGKFTPFVLQGYTAEEKDALMGLRVDIDPELLEPGRSVLVTADDEEARFSELRELMKLPYFVSVPIAVKNRAVALLLTGRVAQSPPFIFPLGVCDVDTLTAIGDLLSSVMVYQLRLDDANKQAQLDVLTGLLNRGAFELRAINLLQQDLPFGMDYAFIVIDLDYFKRVNDSYGHIVGDEALKLLGESLRKFFRSTDLIGRMGGDEFAVFCSFSGDVDHLARRIEKLLDIWNRSPVIMDNKPLVQATISLGVAIAPRDATTYKELFHKADIALYKSKQRGRNRYTFYDAETMSDF
ncbi:MAG TPA: diguanylate cyclase, partial [Terriglobales bacterium]|nr:diguanylate cyclase [Terriglobales bacterium]